jgi:hypothetical protein
MSIDRRTLIGGLGALGTAAAIGGHGSPARAATVDGVCLVPGYRTKRVFQHGRPLRRDAHAARALAEGYDGPVTMVSRVVLGNEAPPDRALFPIKGHAITPNPAGSAALFVGMNDPTALTFDHGNLDMIAPATPHAAGVVFGGHGVFTADGKTAFVTERVDPKAPFSGRPADHFGWISVRDANSLKVLDVYDCAGIAPHELVLSADSRHLIVANYGATGWPAGRTAPVAHLPYGVEPSLTVIEVPSGRLAHKAVGRARQNQFRHLAGTDIDHMGIVQARLSTLAEAQRGVRDRAIPYEPDTSEPHGLGYLPVPYLRFSATGAAAGLHETMPASPVLFQRGQSIEYDATHDEMLVAVTSSNTVAVFAGQDGALKKVIRADRFGLRRPRGIAFLPDGAHYAVSGHWSGVYVFKRGSHALVREACRYDLLFGHSHLAAL